MTPPVPRLHAVTTRDIVERPDFLDRAAEVLAVGGVALQIRASSLAGSTLVALAEHLTQRVADAVVLVNDRADVATASAYAGAHLPEAGLPIPGTRDLLGPAKLIGRSTHTAPVARDAIGHGADYVFLGPIYSTASHPDRPALGPDVLTEVRDLPIFAIGGVTIDRVAACRDAGATGVAAIRAIWDSDSPAAAAEAMRVLLD